MLDDSIAQGIQQEAPKNRDDTRVRLSHNVRAHTATLAAVRPVDKLTRGQIQSRARDLADI